MGYIGEMGCLFLSLVFVVVQLLELSKCSVILSSGSYCSTGNSSSVQHAVPGTAISITCAVDNTGAIADLLVWTIPSYGVQVSNVNGVDGADIDQPDFVSTVNSFDNTERTTNATLTFTAVSELDGAVVNCADNVGGKSNCTLFILTPPSPPIGVMCTNITQTSLTLSWSPPNDDGGEESSLLYEVTRTPPGVVTTDSLNNTLLMESGLHGNTNYSFTVRANNSVGFSSSSEAVFCHTPPWEVFNAIHPDNIQICLDYNETSDIILIALQDCPPPNPNTDTTAPFDNFTITVSGFDPEYTDYCEFNQPISDEKEYDITVTINNEGGSSDLTTKRFDSTWIHVNQSSLMAKYTELSYSIVNCSTFDDANVTLTITESTDGDSTAVLLSDEQPYDQDYTSFDISSLLSNKSYNYTLLMIAQPEVTVAKYTGKLTPIHTSTTSTIDTTTTDLPTSSVTRTSITTSSPTDTGSDVSIAPIIGGVVGGAVLFIIILIILIASFLVYKKFQSKSSFNLINVQPSSRIHPDDPNIVKDSSFIELEKPTAHQQDRGIQEQQAPTTGEANLARVSRRNWLINSCFYI